MRTGVILLCTGFDKCNHPTCKHKQVHRPHSHHDLGSCYYMKVEYSCVPIEHLYEKLPILK